jgi:hypothetical protein
MISRFPLSTSLRVIGQLLEEQGFDVFDLRSSATEFTLQCASPAAPHLSLVELSFSLPQLRSVDQQAKVRRSGTFAFVRFDGLPEILRALGRHVESEEGELLRISNSEPDTVLVEYRTRDRRVVKDVPVLSIREQAERMYRQRAAIRPA